MRTLIYSWDSLSKEVETSKVHLLGRGGLQRFQLLLEVGYPNHAVLVLVEAVEQGINLFREGN
jgi:hypothetical protein